MPEGFRDQLQRADILGMRVLWFERRGLDFLPPADYPALSIACATTHDLPTLAGWWQGADIAERLQLGRIALSQAARGDRRAREGKADAGRGASAAPDRSAKTPISMRR